MKKIIIILLVFTTLIEITIAQEIKKSIFTESVIKEDFDSASDVFPTITTNENYFILDNGDYLLNRTNPTTQYLILANDIEAKDFLLRTTLRLGPTDNKKSSIGVVMKAQKNGKGAILVEINKKKRYRVRQLTGNNFINLSGKTRSDGWQKNKLIKGIDEQNTIEIRSENNIYDLYINGGYCTSFFVPNYEAGMFGLIIGSKTKARVSYFYVDETEVMKQEKDKLLQKIVSVDKDSIISLIQDKIEVNQKKLDEKIDSLNNLKNSLSNTKELNKKQEESIKRQKATIKDQESKIKQINLKISNMEKDLQSLNEKGKELSNQIEKQKNYSKKKDEEVVALNQKVSAIKKEKEELSEEIKKLNKDLKKSQDSYQKIKKDLYVSENKNTDLVKLQKKADMDIKRLNNKILEKGKLLSQLQEELGKRKDALVKLEDIKLLNNELTQNAEKLKNENKNLKDENNLLDKKLKEANIENQELKQLFIYKDFEVSGVNVRDVEKSLNEIKLVPSNDNEIFSVQIGVFQNKMTHTNFKNLDDVWYNETKHGTYVYLSGQFDSSFEATKHKNDLIDKGFTSSIVVKLTK